MNFLIFTLIALVGLCHAQKGGGGSKGFSKVNPSPARKIQQQVLIQQAPAVAEQPRLRPQPPAIIAAAVAAPQPVVQQTPQINTVTSAQPITQQYETKPEAALQAEPRVRLELPKAALAATNREEPHPAPEPYSFTYEVNDPELGSEVSRQESQDRSGTIVGFYLIRDRDGRQRRVEYIADENGFRAEIKSNEDGVISHQAANALFQSSGKK